MILLHCENHTLKRTDEEKIVAGGFGFTKFSYTCDESWSGYSVSAQFHRLGDEKAYHVAALQPCKHYPVPNEVLVGGGIFTVCLFGVKGESCRATSNVVTVEVCEDGLLDHTLPKPTPDIFNQYVQTVLEAAATAAQAAASAKLSSDSAKDSEGYIRSILVEEEFASQVADWNASFATDVKNARAAIEGQKITSLASLRQTGEEYLSDIQKSCDENLSAYRQMHENAMNEYENQSDAKIGDFHTKYARLVIAANEVDGYEKRVTKLEEGARSDWNQKDKNAFDFIKNKPKTFYMTDRYENLPDAMEWFTLHPIGLGRYSQIDYSEPIFILDSDLAWSCYTVRYTYAEIDYENVDEQAVWVELGFAKKQEIPKGNTAFGTKTEGNNIQIYPATESAIKTGIHAYQPVVPKTLGYGVGCHGIVRLSAMPTAAAKHLNWIVLYTGDGDETYTKNTLYTCVNDGGFKWAEFHFADVGDIENALDGIIAIQNSLIGGENE